MPAQLEPTSIDDASPVAAPAKGESPHRFTDWLRYWRKRRGMSQLELSGHSGISQRHISFMESGRSQPSREMVLRLGIVLQLPLRQRNALLLAAGYAPLYQERQLDDPDLQPARKVLEMMLHQHDPYPATIVDRLWNIVSANNAANAMLHWLLGNPADWAMDPADAGNALYVTLHPQGLRPYISNFDAIAAELLDGLQREALAEGPGSKDAGLLLQKLHALPGLPPRNGTVMSAIASPVQMLTINKDGLELNLITTVAALGVARDITLNELRAELVFPADDASAASLRQIATQV